MEFRCFDQGGSCGIRREYNTRSDQMGKPLLAWGECLVILDWEGSSGVRREFNTRSNLTGKPPLAERLMVNYFRLVRALAASNGSSILAAIGRVSPCWRNRKMFSYFRLGGLSRRPTGVQYSQRLHGPAAAAWRWKKARSFAGRGGIARDWSLLKTVEDSWVSTQSLYMTNDANVAIFPGASGHFSTYNLTPRANYEVHGEEDTSQATTITGQRFTFMRTPATTSSSTVSKRFARSYIILFTPISSKIQEEQTERIL
ncbi:hypothetical protein DPX16_18212 [Anabarilius grahami]|uniref:Uncharacterized protein n=1 Tax=Anabarilius grahami TaxID=495550 RepID=A0A3N0Y957_ANAGA|nr:hypothetical protein DPX16_18212 [Anabarilius grahami]